MFVGADDDTPKWAGPQASVAVARDLGLKAIRITVPWRPGESQLSRSTRVELDRAVVGSWGLRAVLAVYGHPQDAPRDERSRDQYCDYVADLIRTYPTVHDVVIWNEPNAESFWKPQFNPDGTSAAPAAYEQLLARCWSTLHARRPKVNVIAASAPTLRAGGTGCWARRTGRAAVGFRSSTRWGTTRTRTTPPSAPGYATAARRRSARATTTR